MKFSTAAFSIFASAAGVAAFTTLPLSSRAAFLGNQQNAVKNNVALFMSAVVEEEKKAETFEYVYFFVGARLRVPVQYKLIPT